LYYRLNVFPIVIPPLRERSEDIPLLVRHFVSRFAERHRKDIQVVPDALLDTLTRLPWPGNVRELQNVVERAVIATRGDTLVLPHGIEIAEPCRPASFRTLAEVERHHILETLRETNRVVGGWNGAAFRLGLSRTTLIAGMQRLGISRNPASQSNARESSRPSTVASETQHRRADEPGFVARGVAMPRCDDDESIIDPCPCALGSLFLSRLFETHLAKSWRAYP
jgi:hypothetical protein